jgi:hypothetical protein
MPKFLSKFTVLTGVMLLAFGALPAQGAPGTFLALRPPSIVAAATAGSFVKMATHSSAAAQPTTDGRILVALQPWKGKLYAGYGDWAANTGPITVAAYDPGVGAFGPGLLAASTEAIHNFRAIGDSLYAPAVDPSGSLTSYAYARGEPWSNPAAPGLAADHVFDMVTLTGTDLWVVGGSGDDALAWRSLDGGTTWVEALRVAPRTAGDYARFYFAGVLGGKLYVQAHDGNGGVHPASRVFDGSAWSTGINLLGGYNGTGWRTSVFAGKLVMRTWLQPAWAYLVTADARSVSVNYSWTIYDYAIDGGTLYALGTDGTIRRTTDLSSWTTFATAPAGAHSLAVLDGYLYAGTADSSLFRFSEPVSIITISATATATAVPSATGTSVPSATATTAPSATATAVPSATATTVPAATATPAPSATSTNVPSATATVVPSATATALPSATAAPSATPVAKPGNGNGRRR